jgi:hypothetical protein
MSQTTTARVLDPTDPGSWASIPFETLFSLPREEVEQAQQQAFAHRFEQLRPKLDALDKLASRQGFTGPRSVEESIPVFFDHRVLKSYPIALIEKGQYEKLTKWLQRLTAHDLSNIPLDGVDSLDSWMDRLDENGLIVTHSTGTTGKLSLIVRTQAEDFPVWADAYFEMMRALTGIDLRKEALPKFTPGYRSGHAAVAKLGKIFAPLQPGGEANRHGLYEYHLSSDLLSLMGRFKAAEEKGELDKLEIDPRLLEARAELIRRNANRDADLEAWFMKLTDQYRGQRVNVGGNFSDLARLAVAGRKLGLKCEFAPGSILMSGGGMKGYTEAPADWREQVLDFFGVERIHSCYGMQEMTVWAPICKEGYYHYLPYLRPNVLDEDFVPLPREGVQTGRFAVFDYLAQTTWGGFISGDRVTIHWDDDCECGWPNPRVAPDIVRFSELEGVADDKITCAGTAKAYTEFMDYVGAIEGQI